MSAPVIVITDHPAADLKVEKSLLAPLGAEIRVAGVAGSLDEITADASAILTCFAKVPEDAVRSARDLRVIGRYGVGVDNIPVELATELGIPVANVPEYCTAEVTEQVFALLFGLARKLNVYDRAVRNGDWGLERGAPLHRVSGKTLGIVGYGVIGRSVAGAARAFGLRLLIYDRKASDADAAAAGAELVSLDELLNRSDFISLHLPMNEESRHLIGAAELKRMKPSAYLINTARGPIVDSDALADALASGEIAGAGLDVFAPEPLPPDHRLLSAENLIATPHTAFYSEESMQALRELAVTNVVDVLEGRRPRWLVNPEVLDDTSPSTRSPGP